MLNILLRTAALVILAAGVAACDRSNTVDQTSAAAAFADPQTVDESEATTEPPAETTAPLPETATLLPLLLSIGTASLGGALIVKRARRPRQ
jgi:hypothetical protein